MNVKSMIVINTVLLIIAVLLGIVLAFSEMKYGVAVFTVHKLTALGTVVLTTILSFNLFKNTFVTGFCRLIIVIAGLAAIVLFLSGALLSSGNAAYQSLKISHIISSILLIACEVGILLHFIGKLS